MHMTARLSAGFRPPIVPIRYEAKVRAAQINETIELALYSAITHMAVAAAFVGFFWTTPQRDYTILLFFLVALPDAGIFLGASVRGPTTASAVDLGHKVAAFLAFFIGSAWGTMPIALFAASDSYHRMLVVGTAVGVIADVYVLGPIFPVCLLFVIPIIAGGFVGVAMSGELVGAALGFLLAVYAVFVVFSVRKLTSLSVQRIVDRACVSEQNDTIGILLKEFEAGASDWLWEIDEETRFSHVSERMATAAGLPTASLAKAPFATIFCGRGEGAALSEGVEPILAAIAARRPFHDRIVEIETAGSPIWWQLTGKPMFDPNGTFVGYRGVGSDITAKCVSEQRISYMANFDGLTGLANRGSFLADAAKECEAVANDRVSRSLFYLDLDGFKRINDSFGHAVGDEVLCEAAARLRAIVPSTALLARLGGDEFALLLQIEHCSDRETLAGDMIEALSLPYRLSKGSRAEIGVSIGTAVAPDDALQIDKLLMRADLALYRAKAEGRGCCRAFHEDFEVSLLERRRLEDDLRLALARREFEVLYQPIVDLGSGRVTCFEALIRWRSMSRGIVTPADFIPVAESIGLIREIDRWVLIQACTEACNWPAEVRIAVNVSPLHFKAFDFQGDVDVALELSGLDPSRLEIEITEGVFLDESRDATATIRALRSRGIRIALDDFGTGYSSLNYLVTFPVDKIKIDRSFIEHLADSETHRSIVESILMLAKKLSMTVTAEGVEKSEQASALRMRRCDSIQGFLISPAIAAGSIEGLIAAIPSRFPHLVPGRPTPAAPLWETVA